MWTLRSRGGLDDLKCWCHGPETVWPSPWRACRLPMSHLCPWTMLPSLLSEDGDTWSKGTSHSCFPAACWLASSLFSTSHILGTVFFSRTVFWSYLTVLFDQRHMVIVRPLDKGKAPHDLEITSGLWRQGLLPLQWGEVCVDRIEDMVQDIRKLRIIFVLPLNILSFSLQQTFSLNSQIVNNLGFVDCIISITMLSSMAEAQKQP